MSKVWKNGAVDTKIWKKEKVFWQKIEKTFENAEILFLLVYKINTSWDDILTTAYDYLTIITQLFLMAL